MDDVAVVALGVSLIWACLGAYVMKRIMLVAAVRNDGDEPDEQPSDDQVGVGAMTCGGEWDEQDDLDHGETYAPTCDPRRLGF